MADEVPHPLAWSAQVLENDWCQKQAVVLSDLFVFFKSCNFTWLVRSKIVTKRTGMRRDNCYVQVSARAFGVDVGDVRLVLPLLFWIVLRVVHVVASVAACCSVRAWIPVMFVIKSATAFTMLSCL